MRTLIVGGGEVGGALARILQNYYPVDVIDKRMTSATASNAGGYEIMHICFPFSPEFEAEFVRYRQQYQPRFIVIHSTVPPGTSRRLGAIHSPVIGIHPHMDESLTTFVKYLGGEMASEVADYFRRAGIKVYLFNAPETTETMKILDTTFYGICVEYTKEVKRVCDKFGIPFEAWTLWTQNYNDGYEALGHPEFVRPNLVPIMKKVGGHCVLPNADYIDTRFTRLLRELNNI